MTLLYALLATLSGIIAGWLMHLLMLAISHRHEIQVDMVKAIGSYGTGQLGPRARRIGLLLHTVGGGSLGFLYGLLLLQIGIHGHPVAVLAGFVLGHFHGLMVSFILMYWLAEHHPVERYRNATMSVGVVHLVGHVFYGTTVSLIIYIATTMGAAGAVENPFQL